MRNTIYKTALDVDSKLELSRVGTEPAVALLESYANPDREVSSLDFDAFFRESVRVRM